MSFGSFGVFSLAGWALLLALLIYVYVVGAQRSRGRSVKFSLAVITLLLGGGVVLNALGAGLVFIPPQERGLVINLFVGLRAPVLTPGVHFVLPFVESVQRFSIGQQTYTMSKTASEGAVIPDDAVTARTADGQEVFIDATVTYQVDPDNVALLFVRWQDRYRDELVRPQARSIIYNRVAEYRVEEVYSTRRDELQVRIGEDLRTTFRENGLLLTSFALRNITFNQEYANSIEQKQIAQQNAERARFLVEQERQEAERIRVQAQGQADAAITLARAEAEAQLIRAKAEAEALALIGEQLKSNPNLLTYRYVEKLSPNVQAIFLPSNQPFLLDPAQFIGPRAGQTDAPTNATPTP
ncbi:MAG: prohibitin family protein [Thermoflexales bacterium]